MRTNIHIEAGQVWQTSDPRRQRAFRLLALGHHSALVEMVYPHKGQRQVINAQGFEQTGTKGYTRLS